MKETDETLFSDEVIAFLRDAAAFCELLEGSAYKKREPWFTELRRILSSLFLSALRIPDVETFFEESNQKFVTEETYNAIRQFVSARAGQWDAYPEVYDPQEPILEYQVTASISEDIADIYQILKDFLTLYHIGTQEVMNDALWEVKLTFEQEWGQKVLNVLRVIHRHLTLGDFSGEDPDSDEPDPSSPDTSEWFITKRQQEYHDRDKPPGQNDPTKDDPQ